MSTEEVAIVEKVEDPKPDEETAIVAEAVPDAEAIVAGVTTTLATKPEVGTGQWKKNKWNAEEDEMLTRLVNAAMANEAKKGDKKASARGIKWELIGAEMPDRTGKQCREHWVNVLCPDVDSKAKWTPEEDIAIKQAVQERGTCWSELVKVFPGRTSLAIKNRWNSMKRKEERQAAKGESPAPIPPPPLAITTVTATATAATAEATAEAVAATVEASAEAVSVEPVAEVVLEQPEVSAVTVGEVAEVVMGEGEPIPIATATVEGVEAAVDAVDDEPAAKRAKMCARPPHSVPPPSSRAPQPPHLSLPPSISRHAPDRSRRRVSQGRVTFPPLRQRGAVDRCTEAAHGSLALYVGWGTGGAKL